MQLFILLFLYVFVILDLLKLWKINAEFYKKKFKFNKIPHWLRNKVFYMYLLLSLLPVYPFIK